VKRGEESLLRTARPLSPPDHPEYDAHVQVVIVVDVVAPSFLPGGKRVNPLIDEPRNCFKLPAPDGFEH